jgi:hypothetical protein
MVDLEIVFKNIHYKSIFLGITSKTKSPRPILSPFLQKLIFQHGNRRELLGTQNFMYSTESEYSARVLSHFCNLG